MSRAPEIGARNRRRNDRHPYRAAEVTGFKGMLIKPLAQREGQSSMMG